MTFHPVFAEALAAAEAPRTTQPAVAPVWVATLATPNWASSPER